MVLSALFVFVCIRAYRERVGGGQMTFFLAFFRLILTVIYVATFQLIYFKLMPEIGEKCAMCMERGLASTQYDCI